jgi:hypothetical protein
MWKTGSEIDFVSKETIVEDSNSTIRILY